MLSDDYIQIGVTAMRDPLTGGFLPAVPLYVRGEDAPKITISEPLTATTLISDLAQRFGDYMAEVSP